MLSSTALRSLHRLIYMYSCPLPTVFPESRVCLCRFFFHFPSFVAHRLGGTQPKAFTGLSLSRTARPHRSVLFAALQLLRSPSGHSDGTPAPCNLDNAPCASSHTNKDPTSRLDLSGLCVPQYWHTCRAMLEPLKLTTPHFSNNHRDHHSQAVRFYRFVQVCVMSLFLFVIATTTETLNMSCLRTTYAAH